MSKIYLAEKSQLDSAKTLFATCSTAAATAAKTVTVSGFTLKTGALISVKFTYANTAANPTLNVNGTGAKSIYYHNLAAPVGMLMAGGVYLLVYNGARWELMGNHFANSGSNAALLGSGGERSIAQGSSTTFFSKNLNFGSLYVQGYRSVLLSYVATTYYGVSCTLTCGSGSTGCSGGNRAITCDSLVLNIPQSGTGTCTVSSSNSGNSGTAAVYFGNIYLLT